MNPNKKNEVAQNFFNLMIVTNLTLMLAIAATVYNNSLRSSPLFLFLLALGVGISSGTGLKRGGLLGMFLISVWISTKQVIGVWSPDRLYFNLLEIILAAAAFVINGHYHEKLKAHFIDDQGERQKLKLLDLEDTSVGLIKSAIGLLRLREETDRALRTQGHPRTDEEASRQADHSEFTKRRSNCAGRGSDQFQHFSQRGREQ